MARYLGEKEVVRLWRSLPVGTELAAGGGDAAGEVAGGEERLGEEEAVAEPGPEDPHAPARREAHCEGAIGRRGRLPSLAVGHIEAMRRRALEHVHALAEMYGATVVLHTDHAAKKLLPWIDGLLDAGEQHFAETGKPLFSSHMLDLSEESLQENIEICAKYLTRMAKMGMTLEIELGCTGGEEDGVDNSGLDHSMLYTQPEDVAYAYTHLSKISHRFTIAASFGCTRLNSAAKASGAGGGFGALAFGGPAASLAVTALAAAIGGGGVSVDVVTGAVTAEGYCRDHGNFACIQ